ncbi:hypothetical protein [Tardiphaga sp. OK246]|uniref:hypothetical protein n=1 Tax=Tardiphaga sp. OK246 TaxID=1855307 RepID=UPI001FCD735A|nr:hypothetical protein [Tardiphaga sp. OK246]
MAECAADRARDGDFSPFEIAEDLVPDFAMTIRSPDENVAVKDLSNVSKVDLVIDQIAFALGRIPAELGNADEQIRKVLCHRKAPINASNYRVLNGEFATQELGVVVYTIVYAAGQATFTTRTSTSRST